MNGKSQFYFSYFEVKLSVFFASQVLVTIAICFDLLSVQFKNRKQIVSCLFVSCSLISIHFILLEQWTASILIGIAAIRYLTSLFTTSKKFVYGFILSGIIATFYTYSGIASVLSCIGTLLHTVAAFSHNDQKLRQIMIAGIIFWIIHNTMVGSPMAVILELLFLSSNLVGYYRYHIKKPIISAEI